MPEQKKGGFHALEERIHQMEEEDAKQAQREGAAEGAPKSAPREAPEKRRSDAKK